MAMRIAFVYDAAYPFVKGGGEKRIYEIARRLAKRHEVEWITLKWWNAGSRIEQDGIEYVGVGEWKELYKNNRRRISEALYFALKVIPSLLGDYDVVDCTAFPYFSCFSSRVCSVLKGNRLFVTWHEVWDDYWYDYLGRKGFFGKVVEGVVAKIKAKHIAVSKLTADMLEKKGCKAEIIPNGVDLELIESIEASEEYDLIFAGRLIKEKGADVFIRLCKELRRRFDFDFKAALIGEGSMLESLKKGEWIDLVEDSVDLLPFVDEERFYSLLKGAKLFVLPSRREGFGISALEAIACNTPVLTIDHEMNACKELAEMYGFVARNFDEMVEFTRSVLSGDWEAEKPDLSEYDWKNITRKLERMYLG
ncbi:glycosyltransferase family 1 protein [Archaeoglobales archaeon]|nr:MAG: glycosyltransferase family 1 protein [Archaeoglobales archaeon]